MYSSPSTKHTGLAGSTENWSDPRILVSEYGIECLMVGNLKTIIDYYNNWHLYHDSHIQQSPGHKDVRHARFHCMCMCMLGLPL